MNTPTCEVRKTSVKVFRESDRWNQVDRWYTLPARLLQELYVGTWELDDDENVSEQQAQHIRDAYDFPVVLVY